MPRDDARAEKPFSVHNIRGVKHAVLGVVCMSVQEQESMFDLGPKDPIVPTLASSRASKRALIIVGEDGSTTVTMHHTPATSSTSLGVSPTTFTPFSLVHTMHTSIQDAAILRADGTLDKLPLDQRTPSSTLECRYNHAMVSVQDGRQALLLGGCRGDGTRLCDAFVLDLMSSTGVDDEGKGVGESGDKDEQVHKRNHF